MAISVPEMQHVWALLLPSLYKLHSVSVVKDYRVMPTTQYLIIAQSETVYPLQLLPTLGFAKEALSSHCQLSLITPSTCLSPYHKYEKRPCLQSTCIVIPVVNRYDHDRPSTSAGQSPNRLSLVRPRGSAQVLPVHGSTISVLPPHPHHVHSDSKGQ